MFNFDRGRCKGLISNGLFRSDSGSLTLVPKVLDVVVYDIDLFSRDWRQHEPNYWYVFSSAGRQIDPDRRWCSPIDRIIGKVRPDHFDLQVVGKRGLV